MKPAAAKSTTVKSNTDFFQSSDLNTNPTPVLTDRTEKLKSSSVSPGDLIGAEGQETCTFPLVCCLYGSDQ